MLSYVNARYIWLRWEDRAFYLSGGSDLSIKGWGGLKTIFFRPFGPQFGLKIRGGGRALWASPLDPPLYDSPTVPEQVFLSFNRGLISVLRYLRYPFLRVGRSVLYILYIMISNSSIP